MRQTTQKTKKIPTDRTSDKQATAAARTRIQSLTLARVHAIERQLPLVRADRVGQFRSTLRTLRDIAQEAVSLHEELATFLVYEYESGASQGTDRSLDDLEDSIGMALPNESYGDAVPMLYGSGIAKSSRRRRMGLGKTHLALRSALQALIQVEADLFCPDESAGYHVPNRETAGIQLMRELGSTVQAAIQDRQGGARKESVSDLVEAYSRAKDSGLPLEVLAGIKAKIEGALGGDLAPVGPGSYTDVRSWPAGASRGEPDPTDDFPPNG